MFKNGNNPEELLRHIFHLGENKYLKKNQYITLIAIFHYPQKTSLTSVNEGEVANFVKRNRCSYLKYLLHFHQAIKKLVPNNFYGCFFSFKFVGVSVYIHF